MTATSIPSDFNEDNNSISNINAKEYNDDLDYSYCIDCAYNGYPNEKVVYQFDGLRPEDEDGFIYKYILYDYPAAEGKKIKHVHKYNQRLIDELVDIVLGKQLEWRPDGKSGKFATFR